MNETEREVIETEFNKIISKIDGGKIFGIPVDRYDLKTMIVAAYYLGRHESYFEYQKDLENYINMVIK